MIKHILIFLSAMTFSYTQCDSSFTYFSQLPNNVTVLVGDTCLSNTDIAVLDSIIHQNNLEYDSPLEIGTQTWFNGRLRFLVAGNYGNMSGANDTIYTLPNNIGDLSSLAYLYLEWHQISTLPTSFGNLTDLQNFTINNNILSSLPESISNLSNLNVLDLGYNELNDIPSSICELQGLSYLYLFNNNLESLPDCFCDLTLDWLNDDSFGLPYFAIGSNALCEDIPQCIDNTEHLNISLDQFYYAFQIESPQDCDSSNTSNINNIFPYQFYISIPYPNPFNPTTSLQLHIPYDRRMDIRVFDLKGNEIEIISNNSLYNHGKHIIQWNATNYSSGVYYIRFFDGMESKVKKVILTK
tara:strand:+ start:905 stop:1966 length:1062 start_codon:yes stop_codon:yes gene_type:complete